VFACGDPLCLCECQVMQGSLFDRPRLAPIEEMSIEELEAISNSFYERFQEAEFRLQQAANDLRHIGDDDWSDDGSDEDQEGDASDNPIYLTQN